jgi:hypothetical protein
LNTPVMALLTMRTCDFLTPRMLPHRCSASMTNGDALWLHHVRHEIGDLAREPLLYLQASSK